MNAYFNKLVQPKRDARESSGVPDAQKAESPRLVIRGESITNNPQDNSTSLSGKLSFIDYLSFTLIPEENQASLRYMKEILMDVFTVPQSDWEHATSGWNGYLHRFNLGIYGLIAYGGEHQKGTIHVQLYGKGCAKVRDWNTVFTWGVSNNCKITRIDLAYDDYEGETVSIKKALLWAETGLFNSNGRPPSMRMIDDFDSGEGKTLYIGKRANGKMCRVYEKGREQGLPFSPWCRVEVEFRSKGRALEWDIVQDSDSYLSGAYEALKFLSIEQSRILTTQKEKTIAFDKAQEWCRVACGQFVNLLCKLNNNDFEAVVGKIRRDGIPQKLAPYYAEIENSNRGQS
jgi:DNA relaxase NicK